MKERGWLREIIEDARKDILSWPDWMKEGKMTLKEIDILLQMEALKIRVKELEADKLSYESHHEASDKVLYEFQERVRKAESSLVKLKEAVEKINSWDYWCFDPHSEGIEWFLKAKDLLNGVFDDLTSQASPPKL